MRSRRSNSAYNVNARPKLLKANNTLRELNEHLRAFLRREIRWAMRARAHNEVGRIYEALSRMGLIQDLDDLALELGNYYRQIHQETNAVKWYRRVQRSTKLIQSQEGHRRDRAPTICQRNGTRGAPKPPE